MKTAYNVKITIAFIFVITVLSISLYLSYSITYSTFKSNNGFFTYNKARLLTNGILNDSEKNFSNINDYKGFSLEIIPQLREIGSSMQIIDTNGTMLFDSRDPEAYKKKIMVDIEESVHFDTDFQTANPGYIKLSFPLVVKGSQVANVIFSMPQKAFLINTSKWKVLFLLSPVIASCMCVILLMLGLITKLSSGVFKPLKQLNTSAVEIARGNLDIKLRYESNNELGEFTRAFDLMREELKDSLNKQSEYEKSRKELIASISHDLKTPVASIKAYVEGLQDGIAKDPETVERYVSVIKKKTDSLTKLIEDLFQHSLRELGRFKINREEQYSGKLMNTILEPVKMQFDKGSIKFIIQDAIPNVLINVDAGRIEQVILNLIQNSKKYTPEGGSIFFGSVLEEDYLKITIKDTGLGILPEDMPFIFDQFYRGEKARSGEFEGAGLGLSICKYIIEEHGGQIFVNSRMNEGSTFSITIPKV